ncbi:hypothetical protein H9Q74_000523 [Fusarium xylarioides]|nr:hypothetical protein H9Q71_005682 [Fusarium xylarioides]KAG5829389.1 hypothetical protein H9Q74_000523 [Fusarium xylarioides]
MPTSQTPEDLNSSQIELLLVNSDPSTSNASFSQQYRRHDRIETYQPLIDKAKNASDDQIKLLLVNSDPSTSNASFSQRYRRHDRIETYQPLIDKAKNVSDDQTDDPKETGIVIRKALVSPSSKVKDKKGKATDTEKHFPEHACWIWRWELLQLLIASGLFAAICIVLYIYTGKELPEWKNLGITLNTLVSIIATFFRASIAIISSEIFKRSTLLQEVLSDPFSYFLL